MLSKAGGTLHEMLAVMEGECGKLGDLKTQLKESSGLAKWLGDAHSSIS